LAVKLRLKRMGRRKRPFYRIVAIDSRKRRDGAEIERLGWYDPLKVENTIELKLDRIIHWLNEGAQTSETVDNIFKENGLKYRLHLMKEGKNEDEIEALISDWQNNQEQKRIKVLEQKEAKKLAASKAKIAEVEAEVAAAEAVEKAPAEAPVEEVAETAEEVPTEAVEEAPVEVAEEAPAEAPVEEVAETVEEAPEEVAEEAPAEAAEGAPEEVAEEAPAEEKSKEKN